MKGVTPSHEEANTQSKSHHTGTLVAPVQPQVDDLGQAAQKPVGSSKASPIPEVYHIQWGSTAWLIALHIGACYAPWTFTWSALALTVFMHWVTGSLGICLGFHRLLTHTGMTMPKWLSNFFAFIGTLAGEGGPLSWCANHRKHHAYSDHPGDPHSPHDGPWWAHMFWLAFSTDNGDHHGFVKKWVPDLAKQRFLVFLENWFLPIHIAFGAAVTGAGYLIGGTELAISYLVWVVCLRMVAVLHTTWFVNSASHMFGYRNYESKDDSRNNWWVAIIAYGEGWHNNHHAHPRLAQHGHKWWEFDATYQVIRLLRAVGLVKDVVDLKYMEDKMKKRAERAAASQ